MSASRWRDDIEGFRAWAIVPVLLYHFDPAWLPGGYLGVDVFLVISGYLMAAMTLGRSRESSVAALRTFLVRRALRIVPALAAVTGLSALAFAFVLLPRAQSAYFDTAASALVGASNVQLAARNADYFAADANSNPFLHTWSICVELQFYLLFGLALFALVAIWRGGKATRTALGTLAAVILLGGVAYHPSSSPAAYFDLFARLWEFMLGTLAFLLEPMLAYLGKRWRATLLLASLATLLAAMTPAGSAWLGPAAMAATAAFAASIVLLIGAAAPASAAWVLTLPPLRWLGRVSYSAYLVHFPVLKGVELNFDTQARDLPALALYLAATMLLAWACFHWVEQPFRVRAERGYRWRPVLALWAGSLLAVFAAAQLAPRLSLLAAWDERLAHAPVVPVLEGARGEVVVVGDSHAQQLFPAFEAVSARHGLRFVNKTGSACLFTDEYSYVRSGVVESRCLRHMRAYLAALEHGAGQPRVVLVAMRSLSYLSPRLISSHDLAADGLIGGHGFVPVAGYQAMDAYGRSLARIAADLWARGVPVVFLAPLPEMRVHTSACLFNPAKRECGVARAEEMEYRARFMSILQDIEAKVPGFHVWDPFGTVCPGAVCSNLRDGEPIFRDDDHLSASMAARLGPSLGEILAQTLAAEALRPGAAR